MRSGASLGRESGDEPAIALARAWPIMFVVALSLFLGSLMFLTVSVLRLSGHGAVRAAPLLDAPGIAAEPTAPDPIAIATVAIPAATSPTSINDPGLRDSILAELGRDADHIAVAVRRISDGRSASINGDRVYYAASLFKLAILYEAARRASAGDLSLDGRMLLSDEDFAEDLGTRDRLALEPDGTIRVRSALEAMIVYSDNSSATALLHALGGDAIDRSLRGLGLTATSVNTFDLPTTANDMALLMQAVVEGRGLSAAARDEAKGFLLEQRTRDGIPRGVNGSARVGNKTGNWDNATHDVAFVEAPNGAYVIAVLNSEPADWEPLQRISRAVYRYFERTR